MTTKKEKVLYRRLRLHVHSLKNIKKNHMRATKCSNLFSFILTNLTSLRALEKFTTWEDLLKNPLIKFGVAENHSLAVPNDSNGCAEFLQREYELDDYFNNCLAELSRSHSSLF